MVKYKGQLDIDGNGNAWSGLIWKLRSNSAVIKVASRKSHVQWYYDRLVAWKHYIPVRSDLSDLAAKVDFLLDPANEANVTAIARAGSDFAKSLTFEKERERVADQLSHYLSTVGGG